MELNEILEKARYLIEIEKMILNRSFDVLEYEFIVSDDVFNIIHPYYSNYLYGIPIRRINSALGENIKLRRVVKQITPYNTSLKIDNVIFNKPATIVFWNDGTKTIVRVNNEEFDPEKGLAMAIAKKALGNKGKYYDEFKKWLPKEDETSYNFLDMISDIKKLDVKKLDIRKEGE